MLILLAESKTMSAEQHSVDLESYISHKPVFEDMADHLMAHVAELSPAVVAAILGISGRLGIKSVNLAYEFPNKSIGYKALYGFEGDAYRSLSADSLPPEAVIRANTALRIISSAYGVLAPDNVIKPYRLEFNKCIVKDSLTPAQYFKQKNTIEIVTHLKANNIKEVVNLLPADAEAGVDWKIIRAFAKVYKINFKTLKSDGSGLKTPIAKRLKEMRGLMTRELLLKDIKTFHQLMNYESNNFIYSPIDSKPGLPVFIIAEG